MKTMLTRIFGKLISPVLLLVLYCLPIGAIATAQDGFAPIFNGKDLSGWEGMSKLWKVEKGEVVGTYWSGKPPSRLTA